MPLTTLGRRAALTPEEHEDQAIERPAAGKHDLECASRELDGTLVVWNGDGRATEIKPVDQDPLIALIVKGRLRAEHFLTLIEVIEEQPETRMKLLELVYQFAGFLRPDDHAEVNAKLTGLLKAMSRATSRVVAAGTVVMVSLPALGEFLQGVA